MYIYYYEYKMCGESRAQNINYGAGGKVQVIKK